MILHYSASLSAYMDAIGDHPILTREEEAKLLTLAQAGHKRAESLLVRCNMRFVVQVAQRFQNRGLELDELITEGSTGLREAARRFDPETRLRFTSYAVWWIRAQITRAIDTQGRVIRIPGNQETNARRARAKPVSQHIGGEYLPDPLPEATQAATEAMAPFSLDAPMAGEGEGYAAFLASPDPSPEDWTRGRKDTEYITRLLHRLDPKEQRVISQLYGLDNGEPLDLETIGSQYGVSKERVRQIRETALAKLKRGARK